MAELTDTGKHWKLSNEEYLQIQAERLKAQSRYDLLRSRTNRWQGLVQSAKGNIERVAKEMQEYLQEAVTVENKP